MTINFWPLLHGNEKSKKSLGGVLQALFTYALPVVIGLFSLIAIVAWEPHFSSPDASQIRFRVLEDSDQALSPARALEQLEHRQMVDQFDTRRSEFPFWLLFNVKPDEPGQESLIEFPSRHAQEITCWDSATLVRLGSGTRQSSEGRLIPIKAGFAIDPPDNSQAILCRTSFVGPASLSIIRWPASELRASAEEFHRNSGLLDGGIIVLSLFMLITALIVRQNNYVLFSAWLIMNLRVGALSAGWDVQWLGRTVPQDWILQVRLLTVSLYCILTTTMFRALFRDDLSRVGYGGIMRALQWICLPLLPLAVTLSYKSFLPFLWVASALTVAVLGFFLARILMLRRSRVALWYGASFAITLLSSLSEVISAALGYRGTIGAANSVTAALSSSLLAAIALAEQMRQEHKERIEVQAELEHTYEATPIGLFTLDLNGQFMSANPALASILGANVMREDCGHWEQYFNTGTFAQLLNLVHSEAEAELELRNDERSGDDEPKHFLVRATLARGKIEGSLQDITVKSKALEELRYMANNDPLTKVLNRRGIEQMLDSAMEQLAEGKPLALAYLDLDRFKLINGLYGHSVGDQVLKQVCGRVSGMLTGSQQMGRVGGDEFVIVLPDTPIHLASWICHGIIGAVGNEPYRLGDKAFQVRCSIGLIEVSPGTQIKDAVATADRACREAKYTASSGLVVYEKTATAFREREAEFNLVERLASSNATEGLFLEMQPIMSLKDPHASLNFEVLLRMRDPDGSIIPAGRLISAAENSGRTGIVDRWVMATTLGWIDTHLPQLSRTQFVCMNLSGASLNDERFMQDAFDMLEWNPRAASRLCIEITESVALHDLGNTRRFIDKVRSYGVKVALDDFGAGYTSFSYLKDLPADVLKIDGSFIVNMNSHPANVAIVEAIVSLALSLGMKTIAEWAEDNATVQTLAEIGVDYVQGYAVARPQPPARILSATSSAYFIQDDELAEYVDQLSAGDPQRQMDLIDSGSSDSA